MPCWWRPGFHHVGGATGHVLRHSYSHEWCYMPGIIHWGIAESFKPQMGVYFPWKSLSLCSWLWAKVISCSGQNCCHWPGWGSVNQETENSRCFVYGCANRMTGEEGGCLDRLCPMTWALWPVMSLCANFIQPPWHHLLIPKLQLYNLFILTYGSLYEEGVMATLF